MNRQGIAGFKALMLLSLMLLSVVGCRAGEPWAEVAGQRYYVDIADDPQTRAQGLMFRDSMPEDYGMLFIFRTLEPRAFWMRNTRIALDIIYLDSNLQIVAWSLDTPPCRTRNCPSYPSVRPAQYVLEVNAGEMERIGAQIGDIVTVGNIPSILVESTAEVR